MNIKTALCFIPLLAIGLLAGCGRDQQFDPAAYKADIQQWRAEREARLKSEDGWLTLVGLLWLKPGDNSFGSAKAADMTVHDAALPARAGIFHLADGQVTFEPADGVKVMHGGSLVQQPLAMAPDSSGDPTILEHGPVSFYVIERGGKLGVRVKDSQSPTRVDFQGLDYFPIDTDYRVVAHFEPYKPAKQIPIMNVLGMKLSMPSPGALVFKLNGKQYRLDPVLESPGDNDLFVMFRDQTSGKSTYGAGRFLYVPMPENGKTVIDFNKAYNPPCVFSNFATCPLPPHQNWLKVPIRAGEKVYGAGRGH